MSVTLVAVALTGSPAANADPEDLMPYCTGSQTPANNNCRTNPNQVSEGSSPGANPDVAVGVEPDHTPAV